jgi:predicted membrane-bound spermidine synthase
LNRSIYHRIILLFLVSGAAALIYQICWQRLLFESVGVDIESVTIIVSTFMFGLGLGALVGGQLADRYPDRTLQLFAGIEVATAAFGAGSSSLIHIVSRSTINAPLAVTVAANFGLLLFPTLLMGATLPILVRRVMQLYQNIGESVGVLYFANTLGAALGAGFTGFVALYYLGLDATIYIAVGLNIAVAAGVGLSLRVRHV